MEHTIHTMTAPNKIMIGLGATGKLGVEVKRLGGKKALIVTDKGVMAAGLIKSVTDVLEANDIAYVIYNDVQPDPPTRLVDQGTAFLKTEKCDCVIGLGGGSSLDTAKGIALMATNGGKTVDYLGLELVPNKGLPMILMPTTAGTGSEVTRIVVITDESQGIKKSINSVYALPDVALVDPQLTIGLPAHLTAETGIDAMTHAVESLVSADATMFSDIMAEKAIGMLAQYLPMAYAKGSKVQARYYTAFGSTLAGMAFMSSFVGAVHGLAHAFGATYHVPHGRACAVMLPHVMRYNIPAAAEKYARVAGLLGEDTRGMSTQAAAESSVRAMQKFIAALDIPQRLRDYDVPENGIDKLVEASRSEGRFFIANARDVNENNVRELYEQAY